MLPMGMTLRTNILENMFLYFLSSDTERKLVFTISEIKAIFTQRYGWKWDRELEMALDLLMLERVNRGQPGLLHLPRTETYTWQAGFDPQEGRTVLYSGNFNAHGIQSCIETILGANFHVNSERIFTDGRSAFEKITGQDFDSAMLRENAENEARFRQRPKKESDILF